MTRRRRKGGSEDAFGVIVLVGALVVLVPAIRDGLLGLATVVVPIGLAIVVLVLIFRIWRDRPRQAAAWSPPAVSPGGTSPDSLKTRPAETMDEARAVRQRLYPGVSAEQWVAHYDGRAVTESAQVAIVPPQETTASTPPAATRTAVANLPYAPRPSFFSKSEGAFFTALQSAVSGRYLIFSKVRLLDLCQDLPWHEVAAFNRIAQKHVDFVLCEPATFRLVAAMEVDGSSHRLRKRVERDEFVGDLFRQIGVPLIRFPAQGWFDPHQVEQRIRLAVRPAG